MLEISDLCFSYSPGKKVINDVTLTIRPGEFVAIAGRNGSGKTTLTRLIMSIIKPTSGNIILNGTSTQKNSTAVVARHIGYVFQNPDRQIFRDTVSSEVAYGPEQLGFSKEKVAEVVQKSLDITGLQHLAKAYPRSLTKGQKQRVAIASALAMQPEILILDEPTSGQDAWERKNIMNILTNLNKAGVTIVMVTHDMDILVKYVDRVIVMADGMKVFDDKVCKLFNTGADITAWGLREPSVVSISRALGPLGVHPATMSGELCDCILQLVRGEQHA